MEDNIKCKPDHKHIVLNIEYKGKLFRYKKIDLIVRILIYIDCIDPKLSISDNWLHYSYLCIFSLDLVENRFDR